MRQCSNCLFSDGKWRDGAFLKTFLCSNETSVHFDEPIRPQHSCDKHKEIDDEYFNILEAVS